MAIAVMADALQIGLFPLFAPGFASPLDIGLDVLTAVLLWRLLGFHWLLLPSLVVDSLPLVGLLPTWVGCTWLVLRQRR
jgi:hypothetical protein